MKRTEDGQGRAMLTDRPKDAAAAHFTHDERRLSSSTRSRCSRLGLAFCLIAIGAVATLATGGSRDHAVASKAMPLGRAVIRRGDLISTQRYQGQLIYSSRGSVQLNAGGTVTSLPRVGQLATEGSSVADVNDQPLGLLYGATTLYRTLGTANTDASQLTVQEDRADLLSAEAALARTRAASRARGADSSMAQEADVAQADVGVDSARGQLLRAEQSLSRAQAPQEGPDVELVAMAMRKLGYYREGATDSWNPGLQAAVAQWQAHIGATPTGEINPADVVVVSGPVRVSGVRGAVGAAASTVTISSSSVSRLATFHTTDGVPAVLTRGHRVTLSAGGTKTVGRVMHVTSVHQPGKQPSTTVQVAFAQSSTLARISSTQVTMSVVTADRRDVLTVPTQALLALASGGYALQLPSGRLLAVRTGIVQGEDIEVSGPGLHPGLTVVSVT